MKLVCKKDYITGDGSVILTHHKEYDAEPSKYSNLVYAIDNDGERWLFNYSRFYTEQELHEKKFHEHIDELLK